ncbi:hypothetical protein HZH68_012308 [Vespula germanica]|uniref:Uncharacterized protein n=1 Tax=Vespula germanica TaxID=30212 RepID=A0A834JN32_VESGE|nr:hypothetical protein HZH68_012308 [Vespula germanica]
MESSGLVTEWSSLPNASREKKERNRANDDVIASTPIVPTMTMNFRKESCINWMMCALCLASLAVSGILTYREMRLESRIGSLEARCRIQETPDVLVQRLRRELREEFEQHRLAPANAASAALFRIKRDVAECNCPPESDENTNRLSTNRQTGQYSATVANNNASFVERKILTISYIASFYPRGKSTLSRQQYLCEKIKISVL